MGSVGANDLARANDVVAILNAQLAKEGASKEKEPMMSGGSSGSKPTQDSNKPKTK